jgi:hypothetical protein
VAKVHPFEEEALKEFQFSKKTEERDFVNDLVSKVRADDNSRTEWLTRQEEYYERRYCRLFRNTSWPWPGASDIVMPTIDMTIDRLKGVLVQLILTRPLVTFETTSPALGAQARTDEIYFNWHLLKRNPDFKKQVVYGVDALLQYGHCVFKIFWDYRTRNARRILSMNKLPPRYGQLGRAAFDSAIERTRATNPRALRAPRKSDVEGVADQVFEEVAQQLAQDYGIDPDEKAEAGAIQDLVAGLKGQRQQVEYFIREVEANNVRVVCIDNPDFIVPGGALEVQELDRCVHRLWLSPETFRQRARDHGWDTDAIDKVFQKMERKKEGRVSWAGRQGIDWLRDTREGVFHFDQDALIEAWEIHLHHPLKKDKTKREVPHKAWMVVQPDTAGILKPLRPEPYWHGRWPFVQVKFEMNDNRFHSSRGVPEKIDDLDIEITKNHRAKLNYLDLMAPSFQYRMGSEVNPDNFTFIPGRMFPVLTLGDVAPLEVPDRTLPTEREENSLLTWNERYIGSLENIANQQNISEARTATEVRALQSANRVTLSLRGIVIQIGFKEVYEQSWDLMNQYVDPVEYQRVTGQEMRRKNLDEIQKDYSLTPVGTVETSDPVLEAQKAFARFQTLFQIWLQNGGNPIVNGTHSLNIMEALIRWLERDNVLDARAIISELSDEEKQQLQQEAQARQQRKEATEDNIPLSINDLRAEVEEIKKNAPHGKRQRIASG